MAKISVFRKAHFNAAHRLHNPKWTDQKNQEIFGLCNNPHFHGHNYDLIVKLTGEIDPDTGYLVDLKTLKDVVENEVCKRFDHKNLNIECVEFKDLNPTAENICIVIHDILRLHFPISIDIQVRLFETPRNFVEYPA